MTKIFDIIRKASRAPRYYYSKYALKKERRLLKSGQWTVVKRNPKDIFFLQVRDNLFCRPDVSVRYMAIENYYGENDFGFEIYANLQEIRNYSGYSEVAVAQFRKLIDSYEKNGYNPDSFIIADKKLRLRDGAHRLALALYHKHPVVSTAVYDSETFGNFTYQWYLDRGFTQQEIDLTHSKSEQLRQLFNTPLQCIVWDEKEADRISEILGNIGEVTCRRYVTVSEDAARAVRDMLASSDVYGDIPAVPDKVMIAELKLRQPEYNPVKFLQQPVLKQYDSAKSRLSKAYGKDRWQQKVTVPFNFYISDMIDGIFSSDK